MKNPQFIDQRRSHVRAFLKAHGEELARQGSIVSSYRRCGERMVGPYYRLTFRDGHDQRSLYLGTDMDLVVEVRGALEKLQQPRRERRALQRRKLAVRKALAQCRADLRRELARRGLRLQGQEVRGWHSPGRRSTTISETLRDQERPRIGLPAVDDQPQACAGLPNEMVGK